MKLNAKTEVNLGGKSRTLVLDLNALSTVETELDVNLMSDGGEFFSSLTFTKMRVLVWGMLYRESPAPSLVEVGEWLSDTDMEKIGESIGKLFTIDADENKKSKGGKKATDPMRG